MGRRAIASTDFRAPTAARVPVVGIVDGDAAHCRSIRLQGPYTVPEAAR